MINRGASTKIFILFFIASLLLQPAAVAGDYFSRPISTKAEFYAFAKTMPLNISENDGYPAIIQKIEKYLSTYRAGSREEQYALEATKQALYGCQSGGYGIGAILVDPKGNIVERANNEMRQQARSDLHGEMTLLTRFETKRTSPVCNGYQLPPGYVVFSSAEPCPMCMIRLASAGVPTRYVTKNDNDSMSRHLDRLPGYWRNLCKQYPCIPAQASEELSRLAYLLFYTMVFTDIRAESLLKK